MLEKKYYSVEEAAQCLGLSPADVNLLREKHELHGYRDGVAWKYKVEDVDTLAKQRQLKDKLSAIESGDETGDVLLSDVTVGGSESGSSGTVIGGKKKGAQDSDPRLADSDLNIGGPLSGIGPGSSKPGSSKIAGRRSDIGLGKSSGVGSGKSSDIGVGREPDKGSGKGSDKGSSKSSSKGSGTSSDLAMAGLMGSEAEPEVSLIEGINLDEGLTTLDEGSMLTEEPKPAAPKPAAPKRGGDSSVDLDSAAAKSDDDNVVLGGSGAGSDITIGGDSGISLVDPTDSGLSLEEPLELDRTEDDSLELGEDDMLTFSEEVDTDAPTQLRTDEDFMLTPPEEAADEDSESGSQVIALDTPAPSAAAPTVLAAGAAPVAMLDEEFASAGDAGFGGAAVAAGPLGVSPAAFQETALVPAPAQIGEALPEAPFSGLNIAALAVCTLVLILGGMMAYDLMRNMWSWNESYTVSSKLMDLIVGHK